MPTLPGMTVQNGSPCLPQLVTYQPCVYAGAAFGSGSVPLAIWSVIS
jgi:hypothetical protein